MSFALTERQLLDGSKTVTRRLGWKNLKVGEQLLAVNKCMGLRKGEKARVLGTIRVQSVLRERLDDVTELDVYLEGFAGMSAAEFIDFFCHSMKCTPGTTVTRIRFEKVK